MVMVWRHGDGMEAWWRCGGMMEVCLWHYRTHCAHTVICIYFGAGFKWLH